MKNDETTRYYESPFAAHMADFIRYKRGQGVKYDAVPRSLRSFSRFLSAKGADDASIGKELIEEWCSFRPNENRLTQKRRIVETTQFLKYLSERGVDVHLPRPTRKSRVRGAFVPHIFSHEELRRFFEECDRISARTPSMMPVMLPVLFRLLLGCGLRISEALGLRLGDTDLDNGILVIRKAKFNKDRLIPLSDSLLAVLREYSATYHKISKGDKDPFFAHRDGRVVSQDNIYTWFRKVVWAAGISHGGRGNGPRVHDFRHTFSVYSLKAMTDKGMDIYCALPLLSTYLGHASVSATGQYVSETMGRYDLWQDAGIFIAGRLNAFIKDVFYPCPREPFPMPIREQRIRVLAAASQAGVRNVLAHDGSCRLHERDYARFAALARNLDSCRRLCSEIPNGNVSHLLNTSARVVHQTQQNHVPAARHLSCVGLFQYELHAFC